MTSERCVAPSLSGVRAEQPSEEVVHRGPRLVDWARLPPSARLRNAPESGPGPRRYPGQGPPKDHARGHRRTRSAAS